MDSFWKGVRKEKTIEGRSNKNRDNERKKVIEIKKKTRVKRERVREKKKGGKDRRGFGRKILLKERTNKKLNK